MRMRQPIVNTETVGVLKRLEATALLDVNEKKVSPEIHRLATKAGIDPDVARRILAERARQNCRPSELAFE
jgi:hypothetical protein